MYYHIDDSNVSTRPNIVGPAINHSILTALEVDVPVRGFSIKMVVHGCERYKVNGTEFPVHGGKYLLLNRHSTNRVLIDGNAPVEGVCIELTSDIMNEAVASALEPEDGELKMADQFFTSEHFIEQVHALENTRLGKILTPLAAELSMRPKEEHSFNKNLYHAMAEAIISDHAELLFRSKNVKAVRSGTRKDLFRRIMKARELIHCQYDSPLEVADLAHEACMSEFHFYRMFKAWTGSSPHAYLMKVRLHHAYSLLRRGAFDVTDIALKCGFTNIQYFSRAFKKNFGHPPSKMP